MKTSGAEKKVSLFRNGFDQEITIPREYELEGSPLLELLASLEPLKESFPEIDNLPLDDIER